MNSKNRLIKILTPLILIVALLIGVSVSNMPHVSAETGTLSINTGAATPVYAGSSDYSFPDLTVNIPAGVEVKNVTIQFTSAIQSTDAIQVTQGNGFTLVSGSKAGNVSINASGKTAADWESFLRDNVKISLSSSNVLRKLRFSASAKPADAIYDYNAENGHWPLL